MLTGRAAAPVPGLTFQDAWEVAGQGAGHIWSNANPWAAPGLLPDRRIDYVFSAWPRRGGAGHPVRCELVGTEPVEGVQPWTTTACSPSCATDARGRLDVPLLVERAIARARGRPGVARRGGPR